MTKVQISAGHFLEHGNAEELGFFESVQSETIYGGNFQWRSHGTDERLRWLRDTYAAVMLTETMATALTSRAKNALARDCPFPRVNTNLYSRNRLTRRQRDILLDVSKEDVALYEMIESHGANI